MSIAGTQGDTPFIDLDNDGVVDPGETLLTSGAFNANGASGALTLPLSEPAAAPSPDTPSAAPVADAYTAIGNTLLVVGTVPGATGPAVTVAGSVLVNDGNTVGASIVTFDTTSANSGTVTMITSGANQGSFTYLPAVGYIGPDSFTYTLRDSGADGIAGNGDDVTSQATVSITVASRVWYVDNSVADGGDGRSTQPFNSLADVSGAAGPDAAGDIIYIRTGNGTYTGGITLLDNQTLWGENEALVVNGFTLQAAGGDPTIANAAGSGVTLAQGNTLKGFTVGDTTVADIVDGNGTVGNLAISNVNLIGAGQAIDIDQGGTLNVVIDNLTSTSSAAQGVQLAGGGAALTGTFTATTGSISGATSAAFLVGDGAGGANTGGTAAITYGGTISSTTGRAVDIEDRAAGAGDIILSGNIAHASGASEGVFLDDNAAGSIVFSGAAKTINTTAGGATAISISDQSGASVLFSNGGLNIDTTTGTGFNATGGGTVSVDGAGNAIRSTSATALNVVDTTIGAGDLVFSSVSAGNTTAAADPVNGIVLNNTGASGGLSIVGSAGSATLGSGGTIQNTSGAGISLTNTRDVVLDEMQMSSTGGSGVSGSGVTNFSFTNGAINDAGNGGVESAIAFNGEGVAVGFGDNLNGTLTVTGSTFLNSFHAALDVRGDEGTITSANITGNIITNPGSSGINFDGTGDNDSVFNLNDATIAGNVITGSGGSGIAIAIENLTGGGPGPHAGFVTHEATGPKPFSDPANQISITGNTISLDPTGTNAIALTNLAASTDRGEMNFEIRNNTLSGSAADTVIRVSTNGTADTVGVIDNNAIDANHAPNTGFKFGIEVAAGPGGSGSFWNPEATIDITNNTISETDSFGIVVHADGAEGESYVTIANNNVAAPSEDGASGIFVQAGDGASSTDSIFLKIFGNTSAGNGVTGIGLAKEGADPRVNVFGIFDGPGGPRLSIPPTNADVQTFVAALNPLGNGATVVAGDHFVKFDTDGAPNHFGPFPPVAVPLNVVAADQTVTNNTNLSIAGNGVTAAAGSPLRITLSAANGVLSLAAGSAASLTFTAGDGTSDATMTFTGTTAEVNAALANLTYRSQPGFVGTDAITLTTVNLSGLIGGAAPTDSDSIDVVVSGGGPVASDITNDFNLDGRSDLVWRGPAGQVETWLAQGASAPVKLTEGARAHGWSIVDSHGDYNGDGRSDILWRHSDGTIDTWLMNGDGTHGAGVSAAVNPSRTLIDGHGDYNGDGKSDLLWREPNGEVRSWLINDGTLASEVSHFVVPLAWSIVDTHGDYNADGRNDVLWRHTDGTIATWLMNGAAPLVAGLITATTVSWTLIDGHGDYNGDGKSDLLWRTPTGEVRSWLINDGTLASEVSHFVVPREWSVVDTQGDYNADGRNDVLWRHTDGTIATWLMNGTAPPVAGLITPSTVSWTLIDGHSDYNGDGKSDLLWRAADGEARVWLIDNSTLVSQVSYGTLPLSWNIADETGPTQLGDAGNNVLTGTLGANLLRGLGGADTLSGNGGGDRFLFDTPLGASNVDSVVDFKSGQDKLVLSDVIFANLAAGPLSAAQLVVGPGAQAQDANDRILYNTATGQLSYDADGSGAGAAVAFATLFGTPSLAATDILVQGAGAPARREITNDLNADGRSDLVWRGPAGEVETWLAQGTGAPVKLADGAMALGWSIVDTHGDYNGDGRSDILWRHTDGTIDTWLMNGDGTHGAGVSAPVNPSRTLIDGHGDYNGDGKSDLLWREPNGEVRSWLIDGTLASEVSHFVVPLAWSIVDTHGDYNADGRNDVLWRHTDGTIATWLMNGAAPLVAGLITATTVSWTLIDGHGDYNGDGKSDLLWRTPTGEVRSWLINDGTLASEVSHFVVPREWSVVDTQGDYNADGRNDVLWRHTDGTIATWLMNGTAPPVAGLITPSTVSWTLIDGHSDYNGDGKSDLLWRAADGEARVWLIDNSTLVSQVSYGTLPLSWNIADETGPTQLGDAGNNVLTGTLGANLLRGLGGADTLSGNGGGDRFLFDTPLGASNVDSVVDFKSGQDKLVLSDVIFANLAAGPLSAAQLVVGPGAQAQDANDRILYNTATGQLSYDADGSGAGAAVAFATLFGTPSLAATDMMVGFA